MKGWWRPDLARSLRWYGWHPLEGLGYHSALTGPIEADLFTDRMKRLGFMVNTEGVNLDPYLDDGEDPPPPGAVI